MKEFFTKLLKKKKKTETLGLKNSVNQMKNPLECLEK